MKGFKKKLISLALALPLALGLYPNSVKAKKKCDFIGYYTVVNGVEVLKWKKICYNDLPSDPSQSTNSTTLYHKPQKHYNWIKPDKYDNWQCAYELVYPNNDKTSKPKGFKLYVDTDGDGKPDYKYTYHFNGINAFFGGATYEFSLDTNILPVGTGWKDNAYKAMNVCGPDAIKALFYKRDDLAEEPSEYVIKNVNYDIYYPKVTFMRR